MSVTDSLTTYGRRLVVGGGGARTNPGKGRGRGGGGGMGLGGGQGGRGRKASLDADAEAYILAVETADGQPLEPAVRTAVNSFVVGLKADGIWDAIKASCILAGARTVAGALTPLRGAAPSNNGFIVSDYSRVDGMKGDGSSKYLDSNRANNADPQNDNHMSVYIKTNNTTPGGFLDANGTLTGANNIYHDGGSFFFRSRRGSTATARADGGTTADSFVGITRSGPASFSYRLNGTTAADARVSQVPTSTTVQVFRRASGAAYVNARVSFYSIGTDLDLALLDARVATLMSDIESGIGDGSLDIDALSYILAVESADGQTLESGVRTAINDFVVGLKTDGVWDAIEASCILAGARTLAGALTPLKGAVPTNNGFIGADYDREAGITGNGSSKYLDTNRNNNDDPQNDKHISIYLSTAADGGVMGAYDGTTSGPGSTWIARDATTTYLRVNTGSSVSTVETAFTGFAGITRAASGTFSKRISGTTTTGISSTSGSPANETINVLRQGQGTYSSSQAAFYSVGTDLDLTLLGNRVDTLIADIAAAIV